MWNWIFGVLAAVLAVVVVVLFCLNYEVSIDREPTPVVATVPVAPPPALPTPPAPPPPRITCSTCVAQALSLVPMPEQGTQVLAQAHLDCAMLNCQQ